MDENTNPPRLLTAQWTQKTDTCGEMALRVSGVVGALAALGFVIAAFSVEFVGDSYTWINRGVWLTAATVAALFSTTCFVSCAVMKALRALDSKQSD